MTMQKPTLAQASLLATPTVPSNFTTLDEATQAVCSVLLDLRVEYSADFDKVDKYIKQHLEVRKFCTKKHRNIQSILSGVIYSIDQRLTILGYTEYPTDTDDTCPVHKAVQHAFIKIKCEQILNNHEESSLVIETDKFN